MLFDSDLFWKVEVFWIVCWHGRSKGKTSEMISILDFGHIIVLNRISFRKKIFCLMVACSCPLTKLSSLDVSSDSHGIIKWYKSSIRIYNTLELPYWQSFTLTSYRASWTMWYFTLGKSLTLSPLKMLQNVLVNSGQYQVCNTPIQRVWRRYCDVYT